MTMEEAFARLLKLASNEIHMLGRGDDVCVRGLSCLYKGTFIVTRTVSDVGAESKPRYGGLVHDVRVDDIVALPGNSPKVGASASPFRVFVNPAFVIVYDLRRDTRAGSEPVPVVRKVFVGEMANPRVVLEAFQSVGLDTTP